MAFIEPMNYETIPQKAEVFVVPDFSTFTYDTEKRKEFLEEVTTFVSTHYKYVAELRRMTCSDKMALYIHCGLDTIFAFPGNLIVKYENGNVTSIDDIAFSKEFRKV
jgi:hypothetical protein